ncbi:hypothetical protein SLS58_000586 [Diplodia intermedia]|uniref:DNA mismatch repair protein S5 domain-containing protein n=1 Tax=Diplodia intermedia TaxID=856260 RepID=A0ABR3U5D3_9PEZI
MPVPSTINEMNDYSAPPPSVLTPARNTSTNTASPSSASAPSPPTSSSIRPLPPQTARALRSSLTIADPVAAVKELVDNALDAGATSVAVEVSDNGALDVVSVRDNGRSVPPVGDARRLLGRRHCTSKLREYGEVLEDVGRRTLGFRGEALASLAEVCEKVEVTVRCEGERMGEVLRLGKQGGGGVVEAPRKIGAPVGTTVRAEGFFERWPVRRQAALRESEKGGSGGAMSRIRRLLQGYALARLGVRLSLKVAKGRMKKGRGEGWVYAPKLGSGLGGRQGTVADAVWKVVGKGAAAQCEYAAREFDGYEFEAFLPKADGEGKEISGLGQFLSIDARPVSTTRGTLKLIAKAFRDKLKKANPTLEDVREPFLRLNIGCPPGSYDPNVEPSKSDLLFDDPKSILNALDEFLDTCYSSTTPQVEKAKTHELEALTQPGISQPKVTVPALSSETQMGNDDMTADDDLFDELVNIPDSAISHRPASSNSVTIPSQNTIDGDKDGEPRPKRRRTWKFNMYDFDEDDFAVGETETQDVLNTNIADDDTEESVNDITVSNPWTMAKMNTRIRAPHVPSSPQVARYGASASATDEHTSRTW